MIGTVASQDFVPAGIKTSQLDGVLVGFRTAQGKKGLLEIPWRHFGQFSAKQAAYFSGVARVYKAKLGSLILDGFHHLRMLVADVCIHQLRRKIDIPFPIRIPKMDTLGAIHWNGSNLPLHRPGEEGVLLIHLHNFLRGESGQNASLKEQVTFSA